MADVQFIGSTVQVGFSINNLYDLDMLLLRLYANHKLELSSEELHAVTQVADILKRLRQQTCQQEERRPPPLPLRSAHILKELDA